MQYKPTFGSVDSEQTHLPEQATITKIGGMCPYEKLFFYYYYIHNYSNDILTTLAYQNKK